MHACKQTRTHTFTYFINAVFTSCFHSYAETCIHTYTYTRYMYARTHMACLGMNDTLLCARFHVHTYTHKRACMCVCVLACMDMIHSYCLASPPESHLMLCNFAFVCHVESTRASVHICVYTYLHVGMHFTCRYAHTYIRKNSQTKTWCVLFPPS
jgi:hypothetical protein